MSEPLMSKLFRIRKERVSFQRIKDGHIRGWRTEEVWVISRDVEAGWPWPSVAQFDTWSAAMAHIDDEIHAWIVPELKAKGYSIRRDWAVPATRDQDQRLYFVCMNDARVRSKKRNMIKAKGERAAWRAAWRHYKGEI